MTDEKLVTRAAVE